MAARLPAGGDRDERGIVALPTGADARLRNEGRAARGRPRQRRHRAAVPGTWSATSELLADELAPRHPSVTLVEVRYRLKTWNELPSCVADARGSARARRGQGADVRAADRLLDGRRGVDRGRGSRGGRRRCSASPRGSPTACRSTASRASGSTWCMAPGIATCPGSRVSARELKGRIRAGARRRSRRDVRAHRPRAARRGGAQALRRARPPAPLACLGELRRRGAHALHARALTSMTTYRIARSVLGPVIRAVWGARPEGRIPLPSGPLVVVSNHDSLADPFFLGAALDRPLRFLAKEELWALPCRRAVARGPRRDSCPARPRRPRGDRPPPPRHCARATSWRSSRRAPCSAATRDPGSAAPRGSRSPRGRRSSPCGSSTPSGLSGPAHAYRDARACASSSASRSPSSRAYDDRRRDGSSPSACVRAVDSLV